MFPDSKLSRTGTTHPMWSRTSVLRRTLGRGQKVETDPRESRGRRVGARDGASRPHPQHTLSHSCHGCQGQSSVVARYYHCKTAVAEMPYGRDVEDAPEERGGFWEVQSHGKDSVVDVVTSVSTGEKTVWRDSDLGPLPTYIRLQGLTPQRASKGEGSPDLKGLVIGSPRTPGRSGQGGLGSIDSHRGTRGSTRSRSGSVVRPLVSHPPSTSRWGATRKRLRVVSS